MSYAESMVYNLDGLDVFSNIEVFLNEKETLTGSSATKQAYENDIKNFFIWKGIFVDKFKELNKLTKYDLKLNIHTILEYKQYLLKEVGNVAGTVNRKLSTIKGLYDFMLDAEVISNEEMKAFKNVTKVKGAVSSYGVATIQELEDWVEYILNKKSRGRQKNLTKAYIMEFSVQTGYRLGSILKLQVNDFVVNGDNVDVYAKHTKGGKSEVRTISKSFFNKLIDMHSKEGNDKDLMFNLTSKAITEMMSDIRKQFNISENRNITFHSLRKCGATYVHESSGYDLLTTRNFLGHSDTKVTERYIDDRQIGDIGYITMRETTDKDLYKKISHEELLSALEQLDLATKMKINTVITAKNK